MHRSMSFRRRLAGAAALSMSHVLMAGPAIAQTGEALVVSVPAAPLGEALRAFSEQTGLPVVFSEALVQGKVSSGAGGVLTAGGALDALLQGTGLEAVPGGGGFIIRERRGGKAPPASVPAGPPDLTLTKEQDPPAPRREAEQRLGQVTVTGTSLRGIAPESSPLLVFDRAAILESGVSSTEEFLRLQPQTFGGGSSEYAPLGLPGDTNSSYNNTFGSGANLRGLGSGATLTLLNGRRLAPTSQVGDFVDLSMIPMSALQRIDVLSDGASSIYGGDAVAGVVNFVLRDDLTGGESGLRYGRVTSGGLEEVRLSQSLGASWSGGNILGAAEYYTRDRLTLAERPKIGRPVLAGGEPISGAEAFDLLPEQSRTSAILSVNQEVGETGSVSFTGLYSSRSSDASSVTGRVSTSTFRNTANSELIALNFGGEAAFSPVWTGSLDFTYSRVSNDDLSWQLAPTVSTPAYSETLSELWSADGLINGALFKLPGGTVRVAAGAHLRREEFSNESDSVGLDREGSRDVAAVFAEMHLPLVGEDNALPGVRRLELNLSGRLDDYSDFGRTTNPKVGLLWAPAESLRLRGTYSTSFSPPPLGRTGDLRRRGVVYPIAYVQSALGGIPLPDPSLQGTDYLLASGTAGNLDPETSRTWTYGADFDRTWGDRSLSLSLSYYDISFEGRLGTTPMPLNQSPIAAPFIAFNDPGAFPAGTVVFNPSQAELDALIATFNQPLRLWAGAVGLENVSIINTANLVRNLASTETRGIDLRLEHGVGLGTGRLTVGASGNHILKFSQQATTTTLPVETLNTLRNPVDLQLRSWIGYAFGGFSGNLFVNYLDDYRTDDTVNAEPIGSWTTLDLALAWRFEDDRRGPLRGTGVSLSVRNLLDRAPPAVPSDAVFRMAGYDPANASPMMRFVALEVSKRF